MLLLCLVVQDPETGEIRYVGGAVYNDAVDASTRYADFCMRVNVKVGEPVSVKYQAPGDEVSEEQLVSVTDDDDLQVSSASPWEVGREKGSPRLARGRRAACSASESTRRLAQEMFNEYLDALQRAGTHTRTLRIHVFLQPALQFELAEEPAEQVHHQGDDEEEFR